MIELDAARLLDAIVITGDLDDQYIMFKLYLLGKDEQKELPDVLVLIGSVADLDNPLSETLEVEDVIGESITDSAVLAVIMDKVRHAMKPGSDIRTLADTMEQAGLNIAYAAEIHDLLTWDAFAIGGWLASLNPSIHTEAFRALGLGLLAYYAHSKPSQ